jgi:hypothetical protein
VCAELGGPVQGLFAVVDHQSIGGIHVTLGENALVEDGAEFGGVHLVRAVQLAVDVFSDYAGTPEGRNASLRRAMLGAFGRERCRD